MYGVFRSIDRPNNDDNKAGEIFDREWARLCIDSPEFKKASLGTVQYLIRLALHHPHIVACVLEEYEHEMEHEDSDILYGYESYLVAEYIETIILYFNLDTREKYKVLTISEWEKYFYMKLMEIVYDYK
jgi:hypothetical protein